LNEVRLAGLERALAEQADTVSKIVARQLTSVIKLQDRDGLWHTVIDRPDSYLEASATAGFTLALGRALRMRLPGLEAAAVERAHTEALAAICAKIDSQGDFTGVAQQTPPGDFSWYQSIPVATAPFGTGICLMALSEALSE
jgi:unsaturated rhamnogalacturonyl hydrolase